MTEPTNPTDEPRDLGSHEFPADQDELLRGVDPQVVELLGLDRVREIEQVSAQLAWTTELARTPSPYLEDGPNEIDLSDVRPEYRKRIEVGSFTGGGIPSNKRMRPLKKALKIGKKADMDFHQRHMSVKVGLNHLADETNRKFYDFITDPENNSLDFAAVLEFLDSQRELAAELPSRGSLKTLENIFVVYRNSLQLRLQRVIFHPALGGLIKRSVSYIDARARNVRLMAKDAAAIRKAGTRQHEDMLSMIKVENILLVSELMDRVEERKIALIHLVDNPVDDQIDALRLSEEYLNSKVTLSESVLRESGFGGIDDPRTRADIQRLGTSALANALKLKQEQADQDKVKPFSQKLTEARDILRGGRRLQNGGNGGTIQKMADGLHNITMPGERNRLLEHEESGLIVAIVLDKLGNLQEVLSKVQASEKDEIIEILERSRADVIVILQHFDLQKAMTNINNVLGSYAARQRVDEVLGHEAMKKLEIAVEDFLQRANTAPQE